MRPSPHHAEPALPFWQRWTGLSEIWVGADLSSRLLLLLRWLAVLGQGLTLAIAEEFGVEIPWGPCGIALGITLISNVILAWWHRQMPGQHLGGGFFHVLLGDVVTLTFLLYWTGGLTNPFAIFYLVQLTLAAVALRGSAAISLGLLIGMAAASLLLHHQPLHLQQGGPLSPAMQVYGQFTALFLAGAFVLVMLVAIRRRSHRLQMERQKLRQELESRERFLSVAALATGFAHELATPIGTLALAAAEMQTHPDAETAELMVKEAARCQEVLQRLRTLGQEALGQSSAPCEIAHVIQITLADLPPTQRQRITLSLPEDSRHAQVACVGLREALLVLLRNALLSSADDLPVELRVRLHDEGISFIVEDRGPGFTPEMLAHWGEPFRSTRAAGEGMGLGLFFVRRLAASMHGSAVVENRPEGGARVTLALPLVSPAPTAP